MAVDTCRTFTIAAGITGSVTLVTLNFVRQSTQNMLESIGNIFHNTSFPNPVNQLDDFLDENGYRESILNMLGYSSKFILGPPKSQAESATTNIPKIDIPGQESRIQKVEPKTKPASNPELEQATIWWKSLVCLIRERGVGDRLGCIANQATSDLYALAKIFAALAAISWLTSPGNPQSTQNTSQPAISPTIPGDTPAYRYLGQTYPLYPGQVYYPCKA